MALRLESDSNRVSNGGNQLISVGCLPSAGPRRARFPNFAGTVKALRRPARAFPVPYGSQTPAGPAGPRHGGPADAAPGPTRRRLQHGHDIGAQPRASVSAAYASRAASPPPMQGSLPAGGLRLCREGVEPSGTHRKVSGHIGWRDATILRPVGEAGQLPSGGQPVGGDPSGQPAGRLAAVFGEGLGRRSGSLGGRRRACRAWLPDQARNCPAADAPGLGEWRAAGRGAGRSGLWQRQ